MKGRSGSPFSFDAYGGAHCLDPLPRPPPQRLIFRRDCAAVVVGYLMRFASSTSLQLEKKGHSELHLTGVTWLDSNTPLPATVGPRGSNRSSPFSFLSTNVSGMCASCLRITSSRGNTVVYTRTLIACFYVRHRSPVIAFVHLQVALIVWCARPHKFN